MARHIRIPLIADLILTDDPQEIRHLAGHSALDRGFQSRGPLINQLLARRVRSALSLRGKPLPSAMMRKSPERRETSDRLAGMFTAGNWNPDTLKQIAAYVRGNRNRPAGELAQEVIGRVFDPTFSANEHTWKAAQVIEDHLQSFNPVRRILRSFTGALRNAQKTLGDAFDGDLGAVHGTGIAVHNLALSLDRMRKDWADETLRSLTPEQAAQRAVVAPRTVLRATAHECDVSAGQLRSGTLVAMNTRTATDKGMHADLAFLQNSWSRCPAQNWVFALLAETWKQAGATQ